MIGWGDEEFYYFIPDAARQAVGFALRASGDFWPYSQNALYQSLLKRNAMVPGKDGRSLSPAKLHGKTRKVMKIPHMMIDGDEDSEIQR